MSQAIHMHQFTKPLQPPLETGINRGHRMRMQAGHPGFSAPMLRLSTGSRGTAEHAALKR